MKHPKAVTDSPQNQQQPPSHHQFALSSKPLLDSSPNTNNNNIFAPSLFYEPTSVLDPHLTASPATAPTAAPAGAGDLALVTWSGAGGGGDSHQHHLPASDDWDPASWFLPEKYELSPFPDDANPHFLDSPFDLSFDPFGTDTGGVALPAPGMDRSQLDSLISAAHCLETNDFATAHVILSRLNHHLPSSGVSPLQRAVFIFKEALLGLLRPSTAEPPLSAAELVRHIAAHKAFADLSPVPHFATFTATQTLIEALDCGARSIHLIDFDLGLGGQWSSFAQEFAARSRACRTPPPAMRITAVVAEESTETALAADNLRDFARGLNINLSVSFVRVGGLGTLALTGVRLGGGEPTAVVLTPLIFRVLGCGALASAETATALLRFVRRTSPRVVVFVDTEGGLGASAHSPPSLRRTVAAGVEHYAAVLESVEAGAAATGAGDETVRRVERAVVRPRVSSVVGEWAGRLGPWRELFAGAGWSSVPFSEFAESQAEWLVRRAPVEGYHVARREGALVLSWRGRELSSTSAWRC
ncbi:scarecrow-like protein 15 [Canna indica]|uniref:Scarecrow-like protein 15 n=1 Tax=Canna indica TaxID=4628 RepID=A0AAQ3PXP1_9LILI|nr:scarecrow-like protein 15 [Canna indica]